MANRTVTISFTTDNSAFDENREGEVARILRDLAERVECVNLTGGFPTEVSWTVLDKNGNTVGFMKVT